MILDHLISNYLDGDLTPEEDLELRRQLAADPGSRERFDAAVLLHIAMRCEDDAPVPEFDRERTRLAVHERIAADAARRASAAPHQAALRRVAGPAIRRAASLVTAFLMLWVPVKDILRSVPALAPVAEIMVPTDPSEAPTSSSASAIIRRDRHTDISEPTQRPLSQRSMAVGEAVRSDTEVDGGSASTATHDDVTLRVRLVGGADDAALASGQIDRGPSALTRSTQPSTSIMLSTYYAQGAAANGRADGAVTQLAQSIGYGISDKAHVGIEIGRMQYDVTVRYASTSGPSVPALSAVDQRPTSDGELGKLPGVVTPGGQLERQEFDGTQQSTQIWGAAFYQHEILRTDIVSLRGRFGAGAAQDGLLSYLRVQAETRLTGGIALSLGSEARLAPFKTGAVGGSASSATYGAVFSLLYGVRIDL